MDDVVVVLRLTITLATIVTGFTLLKWRERWVDSSWRWLTNLNERLRRPLEVLYVITGVAFIALGLLGLYSLVRG